MLLEHYNVLEEQGPIATKTNKYDGETMVYSFHYYPPHVCDELLPKEMFPFDIMYKSTPKGEHYYVVYTTRILIYSTSGSVTINLNGNTNIKLKCTFSEELEFNEDEFWEKYEGDYEYFCKKYGKHSSRYFFEIKKEDLLKCCQASSISILVKKDDTNIENEYNDVGSEIQPIFKAIYNKTVDSSKFPESINDLKKWYMKKEKSSLEEGEILYEKYKKEQTKDNLLYIGLPVAILIVGFIVILIFLGL